MGDIKNFRRNWKKPKRPLNFDLKMDELKILGTFGLKTKRELWKTRTELSRVRNQARSLLALRQEVREQKEPILMNSLSKVGYVESNATLDDVLNLEINDLLARRLQTIVQKKFYFKTPYQARQAVSHGHVLIGDQIVNIPSYLVNVDEEDKVKLTSESVFNEILSKPESDLGSPETENIEIPAEEVKAEAPAEEVKAEAPAEEVKAEAPAEEVKAEAPAEEKVTLEQPSN